jgi:hypothetical protein
MKHFITITLTTCFSITTAFSQYDGADTTKPLRQERNQTTNSETKDAPALQNNPIQTNNVAQNPKAKRIINPIQKEAMTFMITDNSNALVNTIGKGLQTELEPNFGNVGASEITQKPTTIGYQYHFRDRWTMGVQYTWAQVKSDTLAYPDFDVINQYAYFQYVVKLNSFLASIDYAWKIKNTPKSSYALYSGIALGNSRIDYTTERMNYDKSSSYIPAFNGGIDRSGFQLTLLGIKQHFKATRNFGYHAELGLGINSIGFSYGLTYTL